MRHKVITFIISILCASFAYTTDHLGMGPLARASMNREMGPLNAAQSGEAPGESQSLIDPDPRDENCEKCEAVAYVACCCVSIATVIACFPSIKPLALSGALNP